MKRSKNGFFPLSGASLTPALYGLGESRNDPEFFFLFITVSTSFHRLRNLVEAELISCPSVLKEFGKQIKNVFPLFSSLRKRPPPLPSEESYFHSPQSR